MPASPSRARAIGITVLDFALIAGSCAAIVIVLGGRTRLALAGMRLTLRSPVNLIAFAVAAALLRLWLGRGCRPLPSLPLTDRSRFEAERERFVASARLPRGFAVCAAAAAVASLAWLTPQLRHPRGIPDPGDPLFSAWRIARFTHQLATDPRHLFDGNIFFPIKGTLTFSDATVLEALAGAPFLLLGVDPLVVSNALLVLAFPLDALAFCYAGWRLTGDLRVAFLTAVLGTLQPFHAEHYSHLELQYTCFIPLALVALLDLIARPSLRRGAWLGALVTVQWLASMYLGLMLLTFLIPLGALVALAWRASPGPLARALAPAAAIIVAGFLALGIPYLRTQESRGERSLALAGAFSADPIEYGHPNARLLAYQWITREKNRAERELFPGFATLGGAAVGAIPPLGAVSIATLVSGALAFDWSLGRNGLLYDDLYRWVIPYRGLRVPARFGAFVQVALVVLAAFGYRRIMAAASRVRVGTPVFVLLAAAGLLDLRMDVRVNDYWKSPPGIYTAVTPSMALAEFPWDNAPDYMYFSTWHGAQLLNGYSGSFPDSFIRLQNELATFPSPASIDAIRAAGATHVTFNCALERRPGPCARTIDILDANPLLEMVKADRWENSEVRLYRFR